MIERVRLDKLLSNLGLCTRSKVQQFINANKVTYQGQKVSPKAKVDVEDIRVMGRKVDHPELLTIAVHKPIGYVCSNSREDGDHKIIYDLLPKEFADRSPTLSIAGRLDKWVTGLVVMSQNGKIVERIITPKDDKMGKVYEVVCESKFNGTEADEMASGRVQLRSEDGPCKPAHFEVVDQENKMARLTLYEGKYHQVRRMMSAVGNKAIGIHRTQVGPIQLGDLEVGKWRILSKEEMELLEAIQVSKPAITKNLYRRKAKEDARDEAELDDKMTMKPGQKEMEIFEEYEETVDLDLKQVEQDEEYQRKLQDLIDEDHQFGSGRIKSSSSTTTATTKPSTLYQYKTMTEMENDYDDDFENEDNDDNNREIPERQMTTRKQQQQQEAELIEGDIQDDMIVDEKRHLTRRQVKQKIRDQIMTAQRGSKFDEIGRLGSVDLNSDYDTNTAVEELVQAITTPQDDLRVAAGLSKTGTDRLKKLYGGVFNNEPTEQQQQQSSQDQEDMMQDPSEPKTRKQLIKNLKSISSNSYNKFNRNRK
ncbi:hypothetical protein DFA_02145 [Cavenderia fasciculata]|uniref:RNA-binding S4 domain-containing protein n=1 Tax=Cavenderia fasciculata TaxID=261658 RepID=F4PY91_CACFS|nr:uncharacterized protein DFA_02145 [Cavenderia fasciculata]EGG19358.1 hypothetical protein DFA_02145 [Cavenderia fasciculata]|eukprot:XP_004357629.1 hypothetical protein DFA_02145 [Cavenderia fasciculata]